MSFLILQFPITNQLSLVNLKFFTKCAVAITNCENYQSQHASSIDHFKKVGNEFKIIYT